MTRALLVLALAILPSLAEAATQPYRYRVSWGSIPIVEAEVTFEDGGGRYAIWGKGRTVGPAVLFFDWEGEARSEGARDGWRVRRHESRGRVGEETRRTLVEWPAAEGAPRVDAVPPPDPADIVPLPEGATLGTVDPYSAFLRLLADAGRAGRCEGTARVFDGRRRYDVTALQVAAERLEGDEPGAYAGPALRCRLDYAWIGGQGRDWRPTSRPRRDVWIARLPDGAWVPVRVEISTRFGAVVGRLLLP